MTSGPLPGSTEEATTMPDETWDPKAIVGGLTPEAFPLQPPPPPPTQEELDADIAMVEQRFGLTPRAAAQMALSQTQLFTSTELDTLELAARGITDIGRPLFPLIQRYFVSPTK